MKRYSLCLNLVKMRSSPKPFLIDIFIYIILFFIYIYFFFVNIRGNRSCVFQPLFNFPPTILLQREWFLPMFNIWWYWSECWWKTLEQYLFQTALHPRRKFNNIPLSWISEVTVSPGRGLRKKVGWCGRTLRSFLYEQLSQRNVSNIMSEDQNSSVGSMSRLSKLFMFSVFLVFRAVLLFLLCNQSPLYI